MDVGVTNRWLPESIGPRTESVDHLFNTINLLLGVVCLLTGLALAWCVWRYTAERNSRASHRRGQWALELVWTAIPAVILAGLAFYQLPFWNENKVNPPVQFVSATTGESVPVPPMVRVIARQYEWKFLYPGADGEFDTSDDFVTPDLVLPVDEELVLELTSEDVIHSFAVNALRLKQDVIPQLNPTIWFMVSQPGEWEIICTELCGWGHFRMVATMRVLDGGEYDAWQDACQRARFLRKDLP